MVCEYYSLIIAEDDMSVVTQQEGINKATSTPQKAQQNGHGLSYYTPQPKGTRPYIAKRPLRGGVAWSYVNDAKSPPARKESNANNSYQRNTKTPPARFGTKNKKFKKLKFGLPYDVSVVESKIKDQVDFDKKYQKLLHVDGERMDETDRYIRTIDIVEKLINNPLMQDFL
jgi:hypothetical protein